LPTSTEIVLLILRNKQDKHQGSGNMKNICKVNPLLQLIPRQRFDELCTKWEMDRGVRDFTTWEQTCALILTHIMRLESYREINATLGIARSTFSDANARRAHGFFAELCDLMLAEIRYRSPSRKVRSAIKNLLAIDSSECRVHGGLVHESSWLREKNAIGNKGGLKLHAVWNVGEEWIEDFQITPVRKTDSPVAKKFKLFPGKTYVFDRGYCDIGFWWKIMCSGSEFVSRLKVHQVNEKKLLKGAKHKTGVLWDGEWKPASGTFYLHPEVDKETEFRHIVYRDPETRKIFHFVTSHLQISAQAVATIYKKRWAVELLFRWLKGHLNIRYFPVRNVNAVKILMSIAVLVQLLVRLYKLVTDFRGTLWEALRHLRTSVLRQSLTALGFCPGCRWTVASTAESTA
jgi:hypothetical protein